MAICPLAVDWGNVADWIAVCVAAAGAYAVFKVSRAANDTSARALAVAETLKAREQGMDARKASILAHKICPELISTGYFLFGMVTGMQQPTTEAVEEVEEIDFLEEIRKQTSMARCAQFLDELHVLPSSAFKAITEALSMREPLIDAATRLLIVQGPAAQETAHRAFIAAADELSTACLHAADQLEAVMKSIDS